MPNRMFFSMIARCGAIAWVCLGTSAFGQMSPFDRIGTEFSKEDLDLLHEAEKKLYEGESVEVGTSESWSNSDRSVKPGPVVWTDRTDRTRRDGIVS